MSKTSFLKLSALLTVFSALATAQTDAPEMPTAESITRLMDQSDAYVRLVTQALAWRSPAIKECVDTRAQIENIAQPTPGRNQFGKPTPGRDQPTIPITPQFLLEAYQRTEENTMARLATFSHTVFRAILHGCLAVPAPVVPKTP